jgi:hypothetical protein
VAKKLVDIPRASWIFKMLIAESSKGAKWSERREGWVV